MIWKFPAAASKLALLLVAGAVVVTGFAVTASAQSPRSFDERGRPYYGANGPNVSYQQGPHTRIYVSKRSWLDAGTEVLPGDRKFLDYAFPNAPSFGVQNNNRPTERQPLNPPSDLGGGGPTKFPLY